MLCLTLDIDWAHDGVIADALELIESYGVKATWFATHDTPELGSIRSAGSHEIGLHPNFNPLLDARGNSAEHILKDLQALAPEARSIRSHSLMRSSRLAQLFARAGMTHESNYFLPPSIGGTIQPWRDFCDLVHVPIRWEDDVRLLDPSIGEPDACLSHVSPLIVNFHPIHVYLNTASIAEYETGRPDFQILTRLAARRRPEGSGGTRDRLVRLLKRFRDSSCESRRICDFLPPEKACQ